MMGGNGWGPPRSYAAATDPGGGVGRGWRGGGGARGGYERGGRGASQGNGRGQQIEQNDRQEMIALARRQGQEANQQAREMKEQVLKRKAYLQLKWDLDCNRKHLGRGNIVNILINEATQRVISENKKGNVNKMLRISGFTSDDVMGITINEYRPNQVEVMFKDEVQVDTNDMETKINTNGFDVSISRFDKAEDFLIIYGLPLTNNVEYVKDQIKEAIGPFVKEVTEVKPLVHSDDDLGDDFFKGKRNGNWRVKTIPKMGKQIPNYIVVGSREKVMGKVVYSKNAGEKQEMCADCFSTEHYKRDPDCPGPVKWSVYCDQFKKDWDKNYLEKDLENDEGLMVGSDSRIVELQKKLEESLAEVAEKEKDLEGKLNKNKNVEEKLDNLNRQVTEFNNENLTLQEKLRKLGEKVAECEGLKEQVKILTKKNEMLRNQATESQELVEKCHANVTLRSRSKSMGPTFMVEHRDIAEWRIPSGPQLNLTDNFTAGTDGFDMEIIENDKDDEFLVNMVDDLILPMQEAEGNDNEVNIRGVTSASPPCHGFEGEENGEVLSQKIGETISGLEDEENKMVSDDSSVTENMEDVVEENCINSEILGTPKRRWEDSKPRRKVKPRNDTKEHPNIGDKIVLETLSGGKIYTVHSKKNRRDSDFNYVLINTEGNEVLLDLKGQSWGSSKDEEDPLCY